MTKLPLRLALFFSTESSYWRDVIQGVAAYSVARGPLRILVEGYGDVRVSDIREGAIDGVIVNLNYASPEVRSALAVARLPTVDLSRSVSNDPVGAYWTGVMPDDVGVGRAAAGYLLARGFRRFGFCGIEAAFSDLRRDGFCQALAEAGFTCDVCPVRASADTGVLGQDERVDAIAPWIAGLPRPSGVLAVTDVRGRIVLIASERVGVRVPEDMSLLGVDDDQVLCLTQEPPLSSIPLDGRAAGYEAARLLHQQAQGRDSLVPARRVLIPPLPVVTRRSSDVLAVQDAEVAIAMRFIRDNVAEAIGVDDVVAAVAVSMRTLQLHFRTELGRTVQQEIWRVKVDHAKRLLVETDLQMSAIARMCGLGSASRLSVVCHRQTGHQPTSFRRQFRMG